jgi:predicted nucleic acid-binding Zn ribbon protein
MENSNEQTLKEIINELLRTYKLENGLLETQLVGSWEKTAGSLIKKHTEKIYIRNRKLFIKLDSPALKHELSFAKTKLLKSLNKGTGKEVIDDIIFL